MSRSETDPFGLGEPEPAPLTEEWRAPGAQHVVGRYEQRRFREDGMPMPQSFEARCERCGQRWASVCTSGAVRSRILEFAVRHLHKDPFAEAPRVVRPGSLRRRRGEDGEYE